MNTVKKLFKELGPVIVLALILALLVTRFIVFKAYIPSESMDPTLKKDDQLFATRVYNTSNLKRGDVVIFYFKEKNELLIKRLIGLPGEKVEIDESGDVYINGEKISQPYVVNTSNKTGNFEVPADHFLFLGDNRAVSYDSRYWQDPYISKDDIKGKAEILIYPFNRLGVIH